MSNVVFDFPRLISALILFLIPFIVLHIGLLILVLFDILKYDNYRVGNRIMWILICIFLNTIGPILYFIIGRGVKRN